MAINWVYTFKDEQNLNLHAIAFYMKFIKKTVPKLGKHQLKPISVNEKISTI
jgi:hypothetical protein